jgi:exodeoxyribonuclease X
MPALIFDTEVNSLDAKEVIELAYLDADFYEAEIFYGEISTCRFKPAQPFQAGAVAVHGICPADVANCPDSATATLPPSEFVIAHNVDFDCEVMHIDDRKRICTLALCRRLWPDFKSHTLSAMFLELFGMSPANVATLKHAHSADTDVLILMQILNRNSMEGLWALSEVCRIPTHMPFGKHRGVPINEIPPDYVSWLLKQDDVDQYLKQALTKRSQTLEARSKDLFK